MVLWVETLRHCGEGLVMALWGEILCAILGKDSETLWGETVCGIVGIHPV